MKDLKYSVALIYSFVYLKTLYQPHGLRGSCHTKSLCCRPHKIMYSVKLISYLFTVLETAFADLCYTDTYITGRLKYSLLLRKALRIFPFESFPSWTSGGGICFRRLDRTAAVFRAAPFRGIPCPPSRRHQLHGTCAAPHSRRRTPWRSENIHIAFVSADGKSGLC